MEMYSTIPSPLVVRPTSPVLAFALMSASSSLSFPMQSNNSVFLGLGDHTQEGEKTKGKRKERKEVEEWLERLIYVQYMHAHYNDLCRCIFVCIDMQTVHQNGKVELERQSDRC